MSTDPLLLLLHRDPAATIDTTPSEALLAEILASPRAAPARRRNRHRLVRPALSLTVAAAIAVVVTVAVGLGGGGGGVPDLAARAYAQTAPTGEILHVRLRFTFTSDFSDAPADPPVVDESWTLGSRSHSIGSVVRDGRLTESVQNAVGADGALRIRHEDGTVTTSQVPDRYPDFVTQFRTAYERGRLEPAGSATFAGRPARTYVYDLDTQHGARADQPASRVHVHAVYFLDPDTGTPLGSRSTQTDDLADGRHITSVSTTTVETLDHLPATPENQKLLDFTER